MTTCEPFHLLGVVSFENMVKITPLNRCLLRHYLHPLSDWGFGTLRTLRIPQCLKKG